MAWVHEAGVGIYNASIVHGKFNLHAFKVSESKLHMASYTSRNVKCQVRW